MQLSDRESPQRAAVVTGASGWLGQNLVRALVAQGRAVHALVRARRRGAAARGAQPERRGVVGDVRDPSSLDASVRRRRRASTVFHAAAVIHPATRRASSST